MHADLVGASGFQPQTAQGMSCKGTNWFIMGDSVPAAVPQNCHFLPVGFVSANGRIYCAGIVNPAPEDCTVYPIHGMICKLRCKGKVSGVIFCHHD